MPALHQDMEEAMRRTMEHLDEEERFLRDRVPLVDVCLRRCKTLANVMVSKKKIFFAKKTEIIFYMAKINFF